MNINMIRKSLLFKKFSKPIIITLLGLLLIYYFILFFSPGITFWGVFLKKETTSSERIYTGHYDYDNNDNNEYNDNEIIITVQGRENQDPSANVIFQLPNDSYEYYTVVFQDAYQWDSGIVSVIDIEENILFEGKYDKDSNSFLGNNGRPFFAYNGMYEDNIKMVLTNESIVVRIIDVVYETEDRIRGEMRDFILALLLFIITWVEYCFPLLFFRLKFGWAVYNPEPSESYEFWQKVTWIIMLIIGIMLMIKAL